MLIDASMNKLVLTKMYFIKTVHKSEGHAWLTAVY